MHFTVIFPKQVLFLFFLLMAGRQQRNLTISTPYTTWTRQFFRLQAVWYSQNKPRFPPLRFL